MIKETYRFIGRKIAFAALLVCPTISPVALAEGPIEDYGSHPKALVFIDKMVEQHGFERAYVQQLMRTAVKKQRILDAIARPAEKTKTWKEYRKIFISQKRTLQGKAFMKANADTLARAERDFGVPKEIIAAIIGVETPVFEFLQWIDHHLKPAFANPLI